VTRLRTRHRLVPLALLGALTLGSACTGEKEPATTDKRGVPTPTDSGQESPAAPASLGLVANPVDSPAIAEVGEVVATVQLPSGMALSDLAAAMDGIQPGASAVLKMQLPSLLEGAAGFDIEDSAKIDAPLSFVIVNPASHPQPLALLVEAKDAQKLTEQAKAAGHEVEQRDNLLLIGPADVVSAAKEFAFTNLTKYPDHSEIIIYPQLLLSSYAGMIEAGIAEMGGSLAAFGAGADGMTKMLQEYVKGLISLAQQTERVVISISGSPGTAELIVRAYPVAGSVLASFVEAQIPSQHALLGKLPVSDGTVLASGDMRAGAARDVLVDFGIGILAPMYASISAEEWRAMFKPLLDNFDGSFAMTANMPIPGKSGMEMRGLWGVSDADAVRTSWREISATMVSGPAMEIMGMKFISKHQPKVLEHDGIEIDLFSQTVDTSALPPEQVAALAATATSMNQSTHFATFDQFAAMANADADGQSMGMLIDAARGKGATLDLAGQLGTVLEASRQRGDSMLMYFDFGAIMAMTPTLTGPPQIPFRSVSMGFGKHQGALSMRLSLAK
jgi:hypothetical protein